MTTRSTDSRSLSPAGPARRERRGESRGADADAGILIPIASVVAFAVAPTVRLVAANAGRPIDGRGLLVLTGIVVLILTAPLPVAAWRWGRAGLRRTSVFMSFCALAFFHYESIAGTAPGHGSDFLWFLLLTTTALIALVPLSRSRLFQMYVATVGIAMAISPVLMIRGPQLGSEVSQGGDPVEHLQHSPNIYFFVVDGYGRADVLEGLFPTLELRPFHESLTAKGFEVSHDATANYGMTLLSVPATLDMAYPYLDGEIYEPGRLERMFSGENRLIRELRASGYTYVYAPAAYWATPCSGVEDLCLQSSERLSETQMAYLEPTPLASFIMDLAGIRAARSDPSGVVEEVGRRRPGTPKFVLAHIMSPHPPYVRDADCRIRSEGNIRWDATDQRLYADAISCLNRQLEAAIEGILTDREDAIVVIQADHGPGFLHDLESDAAVTPAALRERYSIFSAVRLGPTCPELEIPDDLTPVNTFRLVLACLRHKTPELLPNRSYLTFHDVAGRSRQVEKINVAGGP